MRASIWMFVSGLAAALPAIATAEVRTTTTAVSLRKRPGEKAAVVATLAVGAEVDVIREEGRWLFVRVKGAEGYLTRTTVTAPPAEPPADATHWSAPRRTGAELSTALVVEVTVAVASLRTAPTPTGPVVSSLPRASKIEVLDAATQRGWIHGRDEAGHDGWIARGDVTDGATAVTLGTEVRAEAPAVFQRAERHALELRAELGIGMRSVGMNLTSNADGGLANYIVDAQAPAVTLAVDATRRGRGRWFAGADALVQASDASPGIAYPGPTSAPGTIAFRTFAADAGLRGGLRLRRAIDVAVRVGGHYDAFLPRDVENAGMLPRERLAGLTVGARSSITPPTSRIAAELRLDVLAVGSRAQTAGLADGTSSTARAMWAGVVVRYAWSRRWIAFAAYDFSRASTAWSGRSERQAGVTETRRVDTGQLVQLGIGASL